MIRYLFTGHGYSSSNTGTFAAQFVTQQDINPSAAPIYTVLPGRFSNLAAVQFGDFTGRAGSFNSRVFALETNKIVFVALDVYLDGYVDGIIDRYIAGFTNGNIIFPGTFETPTQVSNQANQYCTLIQNTLGRLELRSNGSVLATSSQILSDKVWYRITIKANLQTSGAFDVYVNGAQYIAYTGNTGNSITTGLYRVRLGSRNVWTGTTAIWDTSDPDATSQGFMDLRTDFQMYQILPDGAGSVTDGTPVGAAANWQCVDETFRNGTTDYVQLNATTTDSDYYTYTATGYPTASKTVISVVALPAANMNSTGTATLAFEAKVGASFGSSPVQSLPLAIGNTVYGNTVGPLEISVSPDDGLQWQVSDVDAAEFGVTAS